MDLRWGSLEASAGREVGSSSLALGRWAAAALGSAALQSLTSLSLAFLHLFVSLCPGQVYGQELVCTLCVSGFRGSKDCAQAAGLRGSWQRPR